MGMKKILRILAGTLCLAAVACQGNKTGNYNWEDDLQYRIGVDFCRSADEVKAYIQKYIPDVTDEQIADWTKSGKLEAMEIGGELKYFRNAAPNLFRVDSKCAEIKLLADGPELSPHYTLGSREISMLAAQVMDGGENIGLPVRMKVRYTLTVEPDAVPAGEVLRCWLPFPRSDVPRQTDVKFIEAGWKTVNAEGFETEGLRAKDKSLKDLIFSGDSCAHSTLYMEAKAEEGCKTVFYEDFEYTASSEWYPLGISTPETMAAIEGLSALDDPANYLGEREKHIIFTPEILALRDSLSQGLTDKVEMARAFYNWIEAEFPWASAREYSTIDNIPMYVLANGHGDCGQVSLLFITLCRSAGIPARFQSGFMMHPGSVNLHDWSEIWLDEYGWVPVDQSFGGVSYFGGMDSYRMVVNCDYGRALVPEKKYPRSETVDFQRGEVEWKGGNLYFPYWNYDLDVEYLTPVI